jgi:acyl-CoA synthetase (AMP-forming)/AMP-acid ligase II
LETISRFRATVSGAPNFAYELCLAKVKPRQIEGLDLHAWDVAYSGAEPIRPDTLHRFAETFAPCGFRRSAFFPCYGLAEATLIVAGGPKELPSRTVSIDGEALKKQSIAKPGAGKKLVGCGQPIEKHLVIVVEPDSGKRCAEKHVGEIWVQGTSIASGYWNRSRETRETFAASLADSDEGPFLRTGDLGFLDDGCLFVVGRIKDTIIIRGSNHYPQDIELTAANSHGGLRADACAAFSVEDGEERLVIVQEIERAWRGDPVEILDTIRRNIAKGTWAFGFCNHSYQARNYPQDDEWQDTTASSAYRI